MKKLLYVLSILFLLAACETSGGGRIPTDKHGIPNVCGCGGDPTPSSSYSGTGGVGQEESEKAVK
jgi:hypothetical protein